MRFGSLLVSIDQFVQRIKAFIATPTGLTLTIIGSVVVLALIVITIIASSRNNYYKQVKIYEKQLKSNDNITIKSKLERLKIIGQNNVVYLKVYEEQLTTYETLMHTYYDSLQTNLVLLRQNLSQEKFRLVSKGVKDYKAQYALYEEKLGEFERQLHEITKNDEQIRLSEVEIKNQFKKCREQFSEQQLDLTIVEEVIAERISNINDKFDLYDQQLNRGNYDDARDYLGSIKNDVNYLSKALEVLPRYCQITTKYFPPKVNSIIEDCNQMQASGYPLYHIVAGAQISKIKEILTGCIDKIIAFDFKNLEEIFTSLDEKIGLLAGKIEEEKQARQNFDARITSIYNKAEDLERTYIKYMSEITELNKIYDISKQANEFSNKIKAQVNTLSITRRALDSLNYGKQPYLMRYNKMMEIDSLSKGLEAMMGNYKHEITNMKIISENAFELVDQAATKLKGIELRIRNLNLEKMTLKYSREFSDGYNLIDKLAKAVSASPIMIQTVDDLKNKLDLLLNKMEESGNRDISFAQYCEKLMMYANNYRASFSDVESSVSKAELLFFEARFEEAIDLVTQSISKLGQLPFKKPVIEGKQVS